MTTPNDYLKYRIDKSNETFNDAQFLAKNKKWNLCINRLYYACFYIVSALLASKDIHPRSHNGVKTRFSHDFIKTGILNKDMGSLYAELFEMRQESDYADFIDFDELTTIPLLFKVEEFIKSVSRLIEY
jgi:uncharacterized protein